MKRIKLGRTGIEVGEFCLGTLPMGPNQKHLPKEEGADIIAAALEAGVDFIDTAQGYKTYDYIRPALERTGIRPVISSKSPAASYEGMEEAVNQALEELDIGYIDIFLLHAARVGENVFDERSGAFRCLLDMRERGVIRAAGISTHSVAVTRKAAANPEVDIVFPLLNRVGMGILDGGLADMERAVESCFENEKGVFIMKALGGGNFAGDYRNAMGYVRDFCRGRAAVAVGVVSVKEMEMNLRYFKGEDIDADISGMEINPKRFLVLKGICKKCGKCVAACHSAAVSLEGSEAAIDESVCLKCGYCVEACPEFAIRMV